MHNLAIVKFATARNGRYLATVFLVTDDKVEEEHSFSVWDDEETMDFVARVKGFADERAKRVKS